MNQNYYQKKPKNRNSKKLFWIISVELIVLLALFGAYQLFIAKEKTPSVGDKPNTQDEADETKDGDNAQTGGETDQADDRTPEEIAADEEQERIKKDEQARKDLIAEADKLVLSYDYDGAIEMIKTYQGAEGSYEVYSVLKSAIEGYETKKSELLLYGGSYTSVTQFNHIFFHSLIADNSKAFDGDFEETGYNMYMTTIPEFEKIIQKMYEDGYVLISIHDVMKEVTKEDGSVVYEPNDQLLLPKGKKPFVLSQDDVNYYEYMGGDGFASRIVLDENGKPTCEMIMEDGSVVTGAFDMVPIIDAFVEEHPDFSYKGAKGIIALTGYEGAMGYRTDDPTSPTYEEDQERVKVVAEALKAEGWEFACHGWGHKNAQIITYEHFERDTNRWLDEVAPLIGPTDIYIFPYGVDFETTMGHYKSDKYLFAKGAGFNFFCGVDKQPWMHLKEDYVRMTRRPLDGQAMIQFPERLVDLFDPVEIMDPDRPPRKW
ncbi:MAG: hypothetical protein K0S76_32 [Herbinix sp.]|jgi:hypothetical protein|nr:hypothetical protein [Herbinix sp.]